tara:strand:+ start:3617 stop:4426 length:810 start_codon:yes stop_codon:yes gene_type:complete
MKLMPQIILLSILLVIGSAEIHAQKPARDTFGKDLGTASWGALKLSQSQLSFTGDDSVIVRREGRNLPNRYQERLFIKNYGRINYDELFTGQFGSTFMPQDYLVAMANRSTKKLGVQIFKNELKKTDYEEGHLFYATKSSSSHICFSFNAHFGETSTYGFLGNKHLRGGACLRISHAEAKGLENRMLALLNSIKHDEGELNKMRGARQENKNRRERKKEEIQRNVEIEIDQRKIDSVRDKFNETKPSISNDAPKRDLAFCFKNPGKCKN